ncbi:PKD domain-containing protein [Rhodocytophaga rosea]|uniref:PKD domain-containing protein n=1 Tax=Rhodocytophaga rosea TaxID=2704465 RepID=A0A6C0GD62_9BACT|nr:Ig-like domain-containing protein [Rhodocytophaga rosea]QHT65828.1 PKD domain-containing protein [Rhodocytophaga rosea]
MFPSFQQVALSLVCLLCWTLTLTSVYGQTPPSGFSNTLLSSGWNEAVGMTFSKDGSKLFVWERAGKVWVVEGGQKKLLLDISPEVGGWHDHGLLGFALHPQFETNGYFYVLYLVDRHHLLYAGTATYNAATDLYFTATIGRLTRYTATKTATGYSTSNRKILIGATKSTGIPSLSRTHGVGSLVFGTDGTLLVSTGDGASPSATDIGGSVGGSYATQGLSDGIITAKENVGAFRSQILDGMNGKILRIDAETGAGIPSNPFYDPTKPNSAKSKVWAMGLRNPFRTLLKPGTGSHNPDDGDPGVLYVGDVGWNIFEELNVVDKPGLNFGWPIYEGLEAHSDPNWPSYAVQTVENQFAPNPLYGVNGCTRQYFRFNELLKQATPTGTATFTNPCNSSQTIPSTIPKFVHTRPVLDWKHGTVLARTGTFSGSTATVTNVGASGSPISGSMFKGNSSTGGVFYTGDDFPAAYKNTYFHGDYVGGWIKNMPVNASHKPTAVKNFIDSGAIVVYMATHPIDGGLYYVNFGSEIRKITSTNNQPPTAVATVNKTFGTSPLTVQFTGSNSTDPEAIPLTYEWNFGDGSAVSTQPNPSHTFTATAGVPTKFTVTLKVKDNLSTSQTTLVISVNNTPPVVTITSPVNNTLYPVTQESTYNLRATVTDAEHTATQLKYEWQTTLYHEDHMHPEPIDTKVQTTTTIDPLGCDGQSYFYLIALKVTDGAGLSTTKEVKLFPNCGGTNDPPTVILTAPVNNATFTAPTSIVMEASASDGDGAISKVEFYNGATKLGEDVTSPYEFNWSNVGAGTYKLTAKAIDNQNLAATSSIVTVTVNAVSTQLPAPWQHQDIGTVPIAGSASYANGIFTVKSSGFDFWTAPDAFHYVYQPVSGNTTIIAKVNSLEKTDANALAGVMIRENLTASSSFATTVVNPGGTLLTSRQGTGKPAYVWRSGTAPRWLKLVRSGNTFTSSFSADGNTWTTIGSVSLTMGSSVYVGLALTSHNNTLLNTSTFSNVSVITSANQPPVVSLTSPVNNTAFTAPASIPIKATASDGDGAISKVEFYNGATKLGEDVTSPYEFNWSNVGAGSYQLTAKAIDNLNASTTSAIVNVSVTTSTNQPPVVSLTSPVNNASYTAPASIPIKATASDAGGSVSKVEFYNGATKLGEDVTSPYEFNWSNVGAGTYKLTAKAIDNQNLAATSSIVTVTVNAVSTQLPAPWQHQDIGTVPIAGSASYANGIFTVKSSGFDFWTAPDAFHYVYQPVSGNTTIIAKVNSLEKTDANALAGVMIRENLTASSSFATTVVNPGGTLLTSRQGTGKPAYVWRSGTAPRWLKLVRSGNTFTSSFSADGNTWTTIGSVSLTMGSSGYVGLALTSHNNTLLNTSTFSNVSVTTSTIARMSSDEDLSNSTLQVYPNPFSLPATIVFSVPFSQEARVQLYDTKGIVQQSLFSGKAEGGKTYQISLQGNDLSNGLYIIRLMTTQGSIHRKVSLLK